MTFFVMLVWKYENKRKRVRVWPILLKKLRPFWTCHSSFLNMVVCSHPCPIWPTHPNLIQNHKAQPLSKKWDYGLIETETQKLVKTATEQLYHESSLAAWYIMANLWSPSIPVIYRRSNGGWSWWRQAQRSRYRRYRWSGSCLGRATKIKIAS